MSVTSTGASSPTTARVPIPGGAGRPCRGPLRAPGWPRALLGTFLGGALGFGPVVALRAISGLELFQTEPTGYAFPKVRRGTAVAGPST